MCGIASLREGFRDTFKWKGRNGSRERRRERKEKRRKGKESVCLEEGKC